MSSNKTEYPICEVCGLRHHSKEDHNGDVSAPQRARFGEDEEVADAEVDAEVDAAVDAEVDTDAEVDVEVNAEGTVEVNVGIDAGVDAVAEAIAAEMETTEDMDTEEDNWDDTDAVLPKDNAQQETPKEGGLATLSPLAKMVRALGKTIPYLAREDKLSLRETSTYFYSQQKYALHLRDDDTNEIIAERRIGYVLKKLVGDSLRPLLMKSEVIPMTPIKYENFLNSEAKYPKLLKSVSKIFINGKKTKQRTDLLKKVWSCRAHLKEMFITLTAKGDKGLVAEALGNRAGRSLVTLNIHLAEKGATFDLSLLNEFPSLESVVINGGGKVINEESITLFLRSSSNVKTLEIEAPVSIHFFNNVCVDGLQLRELLLTIDERKNCSFATDVVNQLKTWTNAGTQFREALTLEMFQNSMDNLQYLMKLDIDFLLTRKPDRQCLEERTKAFKKFLEENKNLNYVIEIEDRT